MLFRSAAPAAVARATAWVVGPGLGLDAEGKQVLCDVLAARAPVVVDADALRMLREAGPMAALTARRHPTVLTPHEGEFAALGYSVGEASSEDRLGSARQAARALGAIVVLKGAGTVIASPTVVDSAVNAEAAAQVKGDIAAFEARARADTERFAMG